MRSGLRLWLALLLLGSPAAADQEAIHFRVVDRPACLSQTWFQQNVLSRTERARAARSGEAGRVMDVRIDERVKDRFEGELRISGLDGERSTRRVEGTTCAEVASALVLIAALALDPLASTEPPTTAPVATEADPPSEPPVAPPAAAPPTPPTRPPERRPSPTPAPETSPLRVQMAAGAALRGTTLVRPSFALGGAVFFDLALASWAFSLGVEHLPQGDVETASGTASLGRTAASLQAGPALDWDWLVLKPGLGLSVGLIHAAGSDTLRPQSESRPWLSAAAIVRVDVPLRAGWFVSTATELVVPILRDRFVFGDPPVVAHEVDSAGLSLGVGLGYRFL